MASIHNPKPVGIFDHRRQEIHFAAAFAVAKYSERPCYDCGEPLLLMPGDYCDFLSDPNEDGQVYAICAACTRARYHKARPIRKPR